MPQSRLIHETDGAQVGFRGVLEDRSRAWAQEQGSGGPAACASEFGALASFTRPSFVHPLRFDNIKTITNSRLAAVASTFKIFAISRQALCRSIRALEMAAFKGKPFRETNEGYLKQRP